MQLFNNMIMSLFLKQLFSAEIDSSPERADADVQESEQEKLSYECESYDQDNCPAESNDQEVRKAAALI